MTNGVISFRAQDGSIVKFECHDALRDTAALAREYAAKGYPDRYVVFSERKILDGALTSTGLFMSCLFRPSIFPSQASLISSLAAVATVTALEEHTTESLGIGWVSKIYCNGSIIGNASIEGKLDNFTSYEYIIVTVSVQLDEKHFPARITDLIKKVFEKDNSSVAMLIAKNVLSKFLPFYNNIKSSSGFMDIYREKFLLRGKRVKYIKGGKKTSCKVLGVDPATCGLKIETNKKEIETVYTPQSIIIPKKIKI